MNWDTKLKSTIRYLCKKYLDNSNQLLVYYQMETSFFTVEKKNWEMPHYISTCNTEVLQFMAGIVLTPIYLPVHVLWFESQKEKKLVITWNLDCKYIKLFAFYQYLQQTIWEVNLIIHAITVVKIKIADHKTTISGC